MTATQMQQELQQQGSLMDKAVCLTVSIESIGNTRKLPTEAVRVDSQPERIKVSKRLLESKTLNEIKELDGEMRRWMYARCLPAPFFKAAVYCVPNGLVPMFVDKIKEYREQRGELVKKFALEYPQLVKEAQAALRSNFVAAEYPPEDSIADYFQVEYNILTLGTPENLKGIKGDLFQQEQQKASIEWKRAGEEMVATLREGMAKIVNHMVDRLTPGEDGKPKKFQNTIVSNVREFLDFFDPKNINDDQELKLLVDKAKRLVDGVDPEQLRKEEGTRDAVLRGFEQIKEQLSTMVVDRPARKIRRSELPD